MNLQYLPNLVHGVHVVYIVLKMMKDNNDTWTSIFNHNPE
jgi:hypothetical protein